MPEMARDGIRAGPSKAQSVPFEDDPQKVKAKGLPVAYVGDVVRYRFLRAKIKQPTRYSGSSVTSSLRPEKRAWRLCFVTDAPIFYNTMEDAGVLPIEF